MPRSEERIATAMKDATPTITVRTTIPATGSVSSPAFWRRRCSSTPVPKVAAVTIAAIA